MALVARFDNPRTQLAVCQWVRRLWAVLVVVNAACGIHEALTGNWMGPLNIGVAAFIVGAYRWALRPMLADARRAHVARMERELGMR